MSCPEKRRGSISTPGGGRGRGGGRLGGEPAASCPWVLLDPTRHCRDALPLIAPNICCGFCLHPTSSSLPLSHHEIIEWPWLKRTVMPI